MPGLCDGCHDEYRSIMMTRKTWPRFLGSFVVSAVLIAACNSGSSDEDDSGDGGSGATGNNSSNPFATGGTVPNNPGVVTRGGANTGNTGNTANRATGGNRFGSVTPAQGSVTARGGMTGVGGQTSTGGAKAGGAGGRGGTSGSAGKANAGSAGTQDVAGAAGKVGSAGAAGMDPDVSVAGTAGQGGTTGTAGSDNAGAPATGGVTGTAGSSSGVAGSGNTGAVCTDGCAGLSVPAGDTTEYLIGLSAVALTGTSSVSLTYLASGATAGTVTVAVYGAGATTCTADTFNLADAASAYQTVTADIAGCSLQISEVIGVGLSVAAAADAAVEINVESLALENVTPAVQAWSFTDASSVSATAATSGKLYPRSGGSGTIAFVGAGE